MKKYLVLFLIFALMCNSSLAFASAYMPANHELSVMIGEFSDDGVATISGKFIAEEEKYVNIMIFAPENSESDVAPSGNNQSAIIPFAGSVKSDKKGEFTTEITLKGESGEYSAYFGPSTDGEPVSRIPVYFWNKAENTDALGILNSKAKEVSGNGDEEGIGAVVTFVDENVDALAFRFSLYEGDDAVNHTEVIKTLITDLKKEPFDTDDTHGAAGHFRTLVFARALNESKIDNLGAYASYLPIFTAEDGLLKDWYEEADDVEKKELVKRLTKLNYTSEEGFVTKAVEMAILTRIHNADGDGEVREMLTDFEAYTGISVKGLKQSVYDGLERENMADYKELEDEINALKKASESEKPSSSGGGGGGGSSITPVAIKGDKQNTVEKVETITEIKGFFDVTEKDWYYDAVYELYDRGIIAGKSRNVFEPNAYITREEIVKMLVVMEKLAIGDVESVFADVRSGDWFCPYVNVAAKHGIVNGIGEGIFGTGRNVTRQDVAVMLYNIAKSKDITTEVTELTFGDADDISDYAKDAVLMLSGLKVINGYEDSTFRPRNFVTRAEASKLIREFIYINR